MLDDTQRQASVRTPTFPSPTKGTSESSVAPERSPCRITSTIRFRMLLWPCVFRPHGDDDADKGASSSPQMSPSGNT